MTISQGKPIQAPIPTDEIAKLAYEFRARWNTLQFVPYRIINDDKSERYGVNIPNQVSGIAITTETYNEAVILAKALTESMKDCRAKLAGEILAKLKTLIMGL